MAEPRGGNADENNSAVKHELTDASFRAVVLFATGLAVLGIIIPAVVWFFYIFLLGERGPALGVSPPPDPILEAPARMELQIEPQTEMLQLRSREEQILQSYEWIDADKGIVRIPIDSAMEIIAREGLPARKPTGDAGEPARGKEKGDKTRHEAIPHE